jgi:uncharacterized membrane protein (DUF485 family)
MIVETDGGATIARDAPALAAIVARRMRVSLTLMVLLLGAFFGFLFLVSFAKRWLAIQLAGGVSLALVLGVAVILTAWLLAWIYARWADRFHDSACDVIAE